MKSSRCIFFVTAMLCTVTGIIHAAEKSSGYALSFEELMNTKVTTSSRTLEPVAEAPNVMYVITAEEIARRGYRNLQDIHNAIPGLDIASAGLGPASMVRGVLSLDRVTIMYNGHAINNITEPNFLVGPINMANIERIEIIVGPGSVLYAPETSGAIINMITKTGDQRDVRISIGNFGYKEATFNLGGDIDGEGNYWYVSGTMMEHDGYPSHRKDTTFPGRNFISEAEVVEQVYPSAQLISVINIDDWRFQYYHRNQDTPYYFAYLDDTPEEGHRYDYNDLFALENRHDWSDTLASVVSLSMNSKRYVRTWETTGNSAGNDNYDLSQKIYTMDAALHFNNDKHQFQAGLLYQHKENRHNYFFAWNTESQLPLGTEGFMESIVEIDDTVSKGLYVSEKYHLTDDLSFVGALRFDVDEVLSDNDKVHTSPRAAVIYRPSALQTFKAIYNTSTHMPSPWLTSRNTIFGKGNPRAEASGDPGLFLNPMAEKPEVLTATELQSISVFGLNQLSIVLFDQNLKDFITWNSPFTNVGDYHAKGVETEYKRQTSAGLFWLNIAYADTSFNTTSELLDNNSQLFENSDGKSLGAPQFTANSGFEYEITSDITFTPMIRYETRNPYSFNGKEGYADDVIYVDAALHCEKIFDSDFTLNISGQNIFDNQDKVGMTAAPEATVARHPWYVVSLTREF